MNKFFNIIMILLFGLGLISPVSSLSISTHIPEKYTDVVAGERLYFEIDVKYPENPKRKDLKIEYEIFDNNNNLVAQAKVLKAIENQASFVDFIVIPKNSKPGLFTLNVKVTDYKSLSEEVFSTFRVEGPGNGLIEYILIIIGIIIFVGFFVIITILNKSKEKQRK